MNDKPGNIPAAEKAAKQAIASLALFGLTEALIDPPSKAIFDAAWRVVFTPDSDALQKIAAMLDVDLEILQKNTRAYLVQMGVCAAEKNNCH
jgi:hypothetical protein